MRSMDDIALPSSVLGPLKQLPNLSHCLREAIYRFKSMKSEFKNTRLNYIGKVVPTAEK